MKWMRVEMIEAEAAGHFDDVQEAFSSAFVTSGAPEQAAMFTSNVAACEDAFYFSPLATSLFSSVIKARGGVCCDAPSRDSVSLLVGNGDPFTLLWGRDHSG